MPEDLPKFYETFLPILEVLSSGEPIHYNELRKQVRDRYYAHLPPDLLAQRTQSGDLLILNRVGWGKAYLKKGAYVHQPKRALVQITEKGQQALARGELTLKQLKEDPVYQQNQVPPHLKRPGTEPSSLSEDATPQDLIDQGFALLEHDLRVELHEKLKQTDPYFFEKVVLRLLKKMGYGDFIETKKSGDGGIDGIIHQDQLGLDQIYLQAKRYSEAKVREKDIRNFIGAMSGDTTKGVFVTTSSFDEGAVQKAKEAHHQIILIDGERLSALMCQFGVGVQVANTYEVKEVDQDFFEIGL